MFLNSFRASAHYEPKTSIFRNKISSKKRFLTLFECRWGKSYEKSLGIEFSGWFGCTRAGLEPWLKSIWLETLIMDFGWSRNWIALEIGLKILEFYVENYLFWGLLATIICLNKTFFWILAHCADRASKSAVALQFAYLYF